LEKRNNTGAFEQPNTHLQPILLRDVSTVHLARWYLYHKVRDTLNSRGHLIGQKMWIWSLWWCHTNLWSF